MNDIEVRDLKTSDLTEEWFEMIKGMIPLSLKQIRANLETRIHYREITLAAFTEGRFVGLFTATLNRKLDGTTIAFLEDMYVLPEFRSRGIATKLELVMLDKLWNMGVSEVLGRVAEHNAVMNNLQERIGCFMQPGHWWAKRNPRMIKQQENRIGFL